MGGDAKKALRKIGSTIERVENAELLEDETYCTTAGPNFNVRSGPNYKSNKLKAPSDESLLEVYALDLFSTKRKIFNIMEHMEPADIPDFQGASDDFYCPKLVVVNIMLPAYAPPNPIWGSAKDDGDNYSVVLYFRITQEAFEGMRDGTTNAHTLLRTWMQADPTALGADYDMRGRLKAIPTLLNPSNCNLGLLSAMVASYNSKPFLTGPKYHSFTKTRDYLEIDVDVHRYIYIARSTFSGLVSEVKNMELYLGIVVQGETDDELPETVLGGIQLRHLKIGSAKPFDV